MQGLRNEMGAIRGGQEWTVTLLKQLLDSARQAGGAQENAADPVVLEAPDRGGGRWCGSSKTQPTSNMERSR